MKAIHIFIDQPVGDKITFFQVHFQPLFLVLFVNSQSLLRKKYFQ
jgi:hypothetical protein